MQLLRRAAAIVVDALGFYGRRGESRGSGPTSRARTARPGPARPRLWRETNAGLRFVLGHRVPRALAVKGAVTTLAMLSQVSFLVLCT